MSAINKALSQLAEKQSPSTLTRAEVPSVAKPKSWLWLLGGFSLSLAVGGWAVSYAPSSIAPQSHPESITRDHAQWGAKEHALQQEFSSPTSKFTPELESVVQTKRLERTRPAAQPSASLTQAAVVTEQVQAPVLVAKVAHLATSNQSPEPSETTVESSMHVEQVILTPAQLAEKAMIQAVKAMDASDMDGALSGFKAALRYQPSNVEARQKLAALYYGKGDTREAYDILQTGIQLDPNNDVLRLALSKFLVKAGQAEAALSPLLHMPPLPSRDYLAMRAALAQKKKFNEIAMESYQLLTEREPENARWWLGLAIQQERAFAYQAAIDSYQQAINNVGISNQSQAFIVERLALLQQLESAK